MLQIPNGLLRWDAKVSIWTERLLEDDVQFLNVHGDCLFVSGFLVCWLGVLRPYHRFPERLPGNQSRQYGTIALVGGRGTVALQIANSFEGWHSFETQIGRVGYLSD